MDKVLRVAFVGAGCINFGGSEGSWDHASRLEKIGGITVVAVIDINTKKATNEVNCRKASPKYGSLYTDCLIFENITDMLADKTAKPDVVILGSPPCVRGSLAPGCDMELQCVKAGKHILTEKPLSVLAPDQFSLYVQAVAEAQTKTKSIISVGYMLRYHAAVQKVKELITNHGGHVISVNAKYIFAYNEASAPYRLDVSQSGGPIVEQATHILDLARYLVGEPVDTTLHNIRCQPSDPAGKLKHLPPGCEDGVKTENLVPRASMGTWQFENGGVGVMHHAIGLHGKTYAASLEILMDGLGITFDDPYSKNCNVKVRGLDPDDKDTIQVFNFGDDDPYDRELRTFIHAVRSGDQTQIKSTYVDAAKTYCFTKNLQNA